jgi:hypothetical protein
MVDTMEAAYVAQYRRIKLLRFHTIIKNIQRRWREFATYKSVYVSLLGILFIKFYGAIRYYTAKQKKVTVKSITETAFPNLASPVKEGDSDENEEGLNSLFSSISGQGGPSPEKMLKNRSKNALFSQKQALKTKAPKSIKTSGAKKAQGRKPQRRKRSRKRAKTVKEDKSGPSELEIDPNRSMKDNIKKFRHKIDHEFKDHAIEKFIKYKKRQYLAACDAYYEQFVDLKMEERIKKRVFMIEKANKQFLDLKSRYSKHRIYDHKWGMQLEKQMLNELKVDLEHLLELEIYEIRDRQNKFPNMYHPKQFTYPTWKELFMLAHYHDFHVKKQKK